jgi:hypothetical protein
MADKCPECGCFSLSVDTYHGYIRCTVFACGYVGETVKAYYAKQEAQNEDG